MEHPPLWAALALTAALASGCATQGYTDMGYQPIVDLQPSQRDVIRRCLAGMGYRVLD